jgi:ubiquinone/menaquinone biosynthesis C-methylase UbiE
MSLDMDNSEAARATPDSFPEIEPPPASPRTRLSLASSRTPEIPGYLRDTYRWAYLDPRNARYLDHELVVKTILWRQHRRLERAAFSEIERGQRVLQSACVYGNFSPALAEHIGPQGCLEVVDVAEVQVRNCRRKLAAFPQATVRHEDVLHLSKGDFDAVCCYFLMHELPDDYKQGVASRLLDSVRVGGKVVFVDYHKPHWAHPLKIVTSLIFDTLEPYAKGLWRKEIQAFTDETERFEWRKETYFGSLYQKVVATRIA